MLSELLAKRETLLGSVVSDRSSIANKRSRVTASVQSSSTWSRRGGVYIRIQIGDICVIHVVNDSAVFFIFFGERSSASKVFCSFI